MIAHRVDSRHTHVILIRYHVTILGFTTKLSRFIVKMIYNDICMIQKHIRIKKWNAIKVI